MPKYRTYSGPVFWDTDLQVATVVMETAQLVLSQLKTFITQTIIDNWIRLFLPKITSNCCELVKLRHINRSGPVLFRHTVLYNQSVAWNAYLSGTGPPDPPVLAVATPVSNMLPPRVREKLHP